MLRETDTKAGVYPTSSLTVCLVVIGMMPSQLPKPLADIWLFGRGKRRRAICHNGDKPGKFFWAEPLNYQGDLKAWMKLLPLITLPIGLRI